MERVSEQFKKDSEETIDKIVSYFQIKWLSRSESIDSDNDILKGNGINKIK